MFFPLIDLIWKEVTIGSIPNFIMPLPKTKLTNSNTALTAMAFINLKDVQDIEFERIVCQRITNSSYSYENGTAHERKLCIIAAER